MKLTAYHHQRPLPDAKSPNPARLKTGSHPPQVYQHLQSLGVTSTRLSGKTTTSPQNGLNRGLSHCLRPPAYLYGCGDKEA